MGQRISIVMPVLNEAATIPDVLAPLQRLRAMGHELILADGGSTDQTRADAVSFCDLVVKAPRGRGAQMNAGAAAAQGDLLLFLHADTRLPAEASALIMQGLATSEHVWGRFDVSIEGKSPLLRIIAAMMNWRSRLTGIATGDQAIFIRREAFEAIGGFDDLPLMEDIAFCKQAKRRLGAPLCLRERVETSGRRWEKHGVLRTVLLMWRLRAAYYFGAEPADLARRYGYVPRDR